MTTRPPGLRAAATLRRSSVFLSGEFIWTMLNTSAASYPLPRSSFQKSPACTETRSPIASAAMTSCATSRAWGRSNTVADSGGEQSPFGGAQPPGQPGEPLGRHRRGGVAAVSLLLDVAHGVERLQQPGGAPLVRLYLARHLHCRQRASTQDLEDAEPGRYGGRPEGEPTQQGPHAARTPGKPG